MNYDHIPLEYCYGSKRMKYWRVATDIPWTLSNGDKIVIPEGMPTDLSSVPKFFWSIMAPFGDHLFAALVHDYLYIHQYGRDKMGKRLARRFADKEFLRLSNQFNRKTPLHLLDNYVRFVGVRLFGGFVY
jgi:hypothetical protein